MKFLFYLAGWLIIFNMCQPVFSQLRDTVNLEEVVVTGVLKPVLTDKSLYQIKSISAREIRGRGATNLSELLSNELSFRISQDAALGSSLRLNGLTGEHVKILIDGIPVVGRQAGILDLSQINLFKVDHIEVVEGPMSVIYGSNALGGVINIITQRSLSGNHSKYRVRTYYETAGVYNVDADITYTKNRQTFNLSGGRHFFGGFSAPHDSFRYQTWKPRLQWNGNAGYSFRSEKIGMNIGSSLFSEELRNKNNPVDNPEKALDEYHFTTRSLNKIDLSAPLSSKLTTTFLASYSYYKKRKKTTVKDLVTLEEFPYTEPASQDTTTFENWMGRWMLGGKITRKMEMQSGMEFSYEEGSGKRIGGEKYMNEAAVFATLKYSILNRLDVQGGLRFIRNSRFDAPLIYNFNTLWNINSAMNLRFSYGRGFRAPSLKELYFEFVDINHHVLGNENLKAEESVYAGMNAEYTVNRKINTSLNLFQNIIDNKIDLLYNSVDAGKAQYYNLSGKKTTIRGMKLMVTLKTDDKLTFQAGSQLNGQSKITSGSYNWTTDASVNFMYTLQQLKSRLSLYYKYNGKYIFYTANYDDNGTLEAVVENYLNKYHSLDVILTKWLWNERFEISGGLKNAFNNKNVIGRGSSGPHSGGDGPNTTPVGWGRTLFLQIQLNMDYDHKND